MSISTLILILLLTFGMACAVDRLVRSAAAVRYGRRLSLGSEHKRQYRAIRT